MKKRIFLIISLILLTCAVIAVALKMKSNNFSSPGAAKTGVSLATLYTQAKEKESKGNLIEAKLLYQQLLADFSNSPEAVNWQKKCEDLNIKLLFSSALTPKSVIYEIKPGDTLTKIAQAFKTTVELIKKSNNISDDKIFPGRKIKVWTAAFSIVVDKSENILMLKADEEVVKIYIVSTGANNSTPVGSFKIVTKLVNPTWFKAGVVAEPGSPENILGSRWLGLSVPSYGIHGTIDPQSLGRQVTQGCVRMANADVEELYTIVPEGTEVTIVD